MAEQTEANNLMMSGLENGGKSKNRRIMACIALFYYGFSVGSSSILLGRVIIVLGKDYRIYLVLSIE